MAYTGTSFPHSFHTYTVHIKLSTIHSSNTSHSFENNKEEESMSSRLKPALITINSLLMSIGYIGGSLISRLYFLHGGHRKWLSSLLETSGFPIIIVPLSISYLYSLRKKPDTKIILTTPKIFGACACLGLLTGLDDFLYAYGLSFLPVSTSVLLLSTHLAFTAFFAYLIVKQKFTPFSINAIGLLTVGAVILGTHASSDRPDGVTKREYYLGFVLTVGAALLYGLVLPLIELTYIRAKVKNVSYRLVMEMQMIMGFFATVFSFVGMIFSKDFQAIPNEAKEYELGKTKYCFVLIFTAVLWQCFYLGIIGVIFTADTLLSAVITAVCIPVTEVMGVVFYHEKFTSEKGISLALALWGLASYTYGEYLHNRDRKKESVVLEENFTEV